MVIIMVTIMIKQIQQQKKNKMKKKSRQRILIEPSHFLRGTQKIQDIGKIVGA